MQMLIFYKECWSSIHHKKGTYQLPLWHSTQKHNQSGIDTENGVFTRQAYKITQHGRHENVINQLSNQVMTLLVIFTDGINPFLLLFFPFFTSFLTLLLFFATIYMQSNADLVINDYSHQICYSNHMIKLLRQKEKKWIMILCPSLNWKCEGRL